ncbi:CdaR family protein [Deinococcus aestuarii]|uniref:CdaR family protein n=1 Tax=Deinococcus aestuarii TaxID=2774531 RepID=UPI001C0BECDF
MKGPGGELRRWLDPRYLWRRALHNLPAKVLAFLVAVTLWFVATSDRRANVEQGFDVPLTVSDTTGGRGEGTRAVSGLTPATVRVTLSGRPERLQELTGDDVRAVVDVTGVPEGSFTLPVAVEPPTGTTLREQRPRRVQGFVDTRLTRSLPVTLSVATPPEASLPRYGVSPDGATVAGPGRVVREVARLVSTPLSLAPGDEREAALIALDAGGQPVPGVTTNPASVTVRRLDTGELPVKAVRVVLSDPPAGLRVTSVSVQPSSVRLIAAPELLARLREVTGVVAYREGTYTAPVTLRVPAGAQALEGVSVRLTVERPTPTPGPDGGPPPAPAPNPPSP